MNCSRFERLLSDYTDGQLDTPVQAAMDEHLRGCGECSRLIVEIAQLREDLSDFPEILIPQSLVEKIIEHTSGKPERYSFWRDVLLPTIQPFLTQRYAFATLMMFAFLSFAVNVMGPGFSAFSYSRFSPSAIAARADELSSNLYRRWSEFNDLRNRVSEEMRLFKEDLLGRLDYHLITILFQSYSESLQPEEEQAVEKKTDEQVEPSEKQEDDKQ